MMDLDAKLTAARELRPQILAHRDAIEADRCLPQPIVDALGSLGIFRASVPAISGGEEWDHPSWLRVVEELSAVDGAVGWNCGVGASISGYLTGWLSEDAARAVTSADANGVIAGAGAPSGKAEPVEGGVRITGRWKFGSGAPNASWMLGGFSLPGEIPRLGRVMFAPIKDVNIIDTWSVGGLRGTGSHDFAVNDLFVPTEFTIDVTEPPVHEGPFYRLPNLYAAGSALAPLALGVARGAIDAFAEAIDDKPDTVTGGLVRDRHTVQERLAKAEATLRSARAYLYETADDVWAIVCSGRTLDAREEACARLAVMHALDAGAKAVDIVYRAAGTSAIFTNNPLERYFRDIHVATQHFAGSPEGMFTIGAVLLGGTNG